MMGRCLRCGRRWKRRRQIEHVTLISKSRGMFPLCEKCWRALAPEDRRPYYRQLFGQWMRDGCDPNEWTEIEAAVLAEGAVAS